jgi:hypothetical protein
MFKKQTSLALSTLFRFLFVLSRSLWKEIHESLQIGKCQQSRVEQKGSVLRFKKQFKI